MKKIVAILQSRTGSTRLPNKGLYLINERPMTYWVLRKIEQSCLLNEFVLVTTTLASDDILEDMAQVYKWHCFRHSYGNNNDLLGLYYEAALHYKADVIVRLTGDNPLLDAEVIDLVIQGFLDESPDYSGNCEQPLTYPIGLTVEVFSRDALERSQREDHNPLWREHVTQYIRRQPEKFNILPVYNDKDYSFMRWTVDTKGDMNFVRAIYGALGDTFGWLDVIRFIEANPKVLNINREEG